MKTKRYQIYSIDVYDLYQTGVSLDESSDLFVPPFLLKLKIVHENPLFDQIKTFLDESGFHNKSNSMVGLEKTDNISEVIVYLEFERLFSEMNKASKSQALEKMFTKVFKEGIKIKINGEIVSFLSFEKSAGMSRESTMAFIRSNLKNNEIKIDFKTEIKKRIMLDIKIDRAQLSKLFAYNGLMLSSGKRIEGLELNEKNVAIVKDLKPKKEFNCVTGISFQSLLEIIKEVYETTNNNESSFNRLIDYITKIVNLNESTKLKLIEFAKNKFYNQPLKNNLQLLNEINNFLESNNYSSIKDKNTKGEQFWYYIRTKISSEINYFDGVGIVSYRLADEICNKIKDGVNYTSFQIRLPYIKGMIHKVDFHSFYKEVFPEIKHLECLDGKRRKIEDIEIILTESQFKGYKWIKRSLINSNDGSDIFDFYWEKIKKYNHSLYVSGVNKNYSQNLIKLNYQFLHTPKFTKDEFELIINNSKNLYESIASDETKQINFILKNSFELPNDKPLDETESNEIIDSPNASAQKEEINDYDTMQKALLKNKNLIRLKGFQTKIKDLVESEAVDFALSRLYIKGEIRYLSSDLFYFLHYIIGRKIKNHDDLLLSRFYAPKKENGINFNKDHYYAILRNPHLTRNEDVVLKPYTFKNTLRNKYFSHLTGIVMVNPENLMAEKIGGADYDGDIVKIIDDSYYVNAVKRQQSTAIEGAYPLIKIPTSHTEEVELNEYNEVMTIKNTFSSRIGQICNSAFRYSINSYNENNINMDENMRNEFLRKCEEYSILIGLEIDSAKNGSKPVLPRKSMGLNKEDYYLSIKNLISQYKLGSKTKKAILDFNIEPENPNLYVLPKNALRLKDLNKNFRKENTQNLKDIFKFEKEKKWEEKLSSEKLEKIHILILIMKNLNKKFNSYNLTKKITKDDYASMRIDFILNTQYNGNLIELPVENIKLKLQKLDNLFLLKIYDKIVDLEWHYLSEDLIKQKILNELFGEKFFEKEEIKLICNFKYSGFELLYFFIKSSINKKRDEIRDELYNNPNVEYENLIDILKKYILKSSKSTESESDILVKNIIDFILSDRDIEIKDNLSSTIYDYSLLTSLINKFYLNHKINDKNEIKLSFLKKHIKNFTVENYEIILKVLNSYFIEKYFDTNLLFDKSFYLDNKKYIEKLEETILKSKENYNIFLEDNEFYRSAYHKINLQLLEKQVTSGTRSSYYSYLLKIIRNEISQIFSNDFDHGLNQSLPYFLNLIQANKDLDNNGFLLWDIYKDVALNNLIEVK